MRCGNEKIASPGPISLVLERSTGTLVAQLSRHSARHHKTDLEFARAALRIVALVQPL
jgi:hypothetical protein